MNRVLVVCAGLMIWLGGAAYAQSRTASQVYFFGNSLVHHLSEDQDHTNIPHWLNELAKTAGHGFGTEGQWGFLRNFADALPPEPNWSFKGVPSVWSVGRQSFAEANFDAAVITPANFIQYQQPDVPYDGDNPTGESPLGASLRILDWLAAQSPQTRLFVYEGWAEMAGIAGDFPPNARGLARYHAFNQADYHDWYVDFIDRLAATRPAHQVRLIPVASVLAGLFADGGVLDGLVATDLYSDDAPHGTPTLYFLAAMVTYAALYEQVPPQGFTPPTALHPDIGQKYAEISEAIWQAMPKVQAGLSPPAAGDAVAVEAAAVPTLPKRIPVALPPSGARPDGQPVLGMGLNGISDWSTQHPFLDLMKTARAWVGHQEGQWGAYSNEALREGGYLDGDGWPIAMPDGVDALETVLLTDQPEEANALVGRYVLTYEGEGAIEVTGRARRASYGPGQISFSYTPGEGVVGIRLTEIDAANPIRNIRIFNQEHVALHRAGALFNPAWIERIQDLRSVRFMDWMMTNGSPQRRWADRPKMSDANWSQGGVPLEVMVRLANKIGADPWFTLPHMADDEYVRQFAQRVKAGLDPRLKAHVEYSNEVWNQIFPQAVWAREQAIQAWGESDTGWMQFYGLRAAQVMDIWTEEFADQAPSRLVRVIATHTGWPGLEEDILYAPLAFLTLGKLPQQSFDAYAVTGYFGYEMGTDEMAQRMTGWLDQAEALALKTGEAQGLRRVALREFVKENRFEAAIAPVTLALEQGSLRELTQEIFPYQAGVARKAGLRLVMYEGGTHVTPHGAQVNDDRLSAFFADYNYSPEMAKLYELLLAGWVQAGGTMFNAFVDVAPATKWGSWGALRHLQDRNPRWDMLMAYNAAGPGEWERRDLAAFANGITRIAGDGNQRLQGTSNEDVLSAGSGDDTLAGSGGDDILNGGAGTDKALLPGAVSDYQFVQAEGRVIARSQFGVVHMAGIEELLFEAEPGRSLLVSGL